MSIEQTLSIIKPDAVGKNVIGEIFTRFEKAGLNIVGTKMLHMTKEKAEGFYAEHQGKPFFQELVGFMTSGPVVVSVVEGIEAIKRHREILGATNPAEALAGTIRATYGGSIITENAAHGSDSPESANREIKYFFEPDEVCKRTR